MKKTIGRKKLILSAHARQVLARRYLQRDAANRVVETPVEMFTRVAQTVAQAETRFGSPRTASTYAARFFDLMAGLDFLPNSPTLMNAGRELGQLSACFVLPVEDSIESIFNAVRDTALIHKSGGGTGFSFSSIRPANDIVKSTRGVSSGPISFMNVFDVTTETIKQGGVRRGANMGLLSVHHPDILDFITHKAKTPGSFSNFNLSVAVTREFLNAVRDKQTYELFNPHTRSLHGRLSAEMVFDKIAESAWACGDPGLVFIDRINEDNPLPHLGAIAATNPCGEQPLLPYESCTLGSINLARFVRNKAIDYQRLRTVIRLAVRFLDNVIDVNRFPLPQIESLTRKNRKIGLGVMGLADVIIRLGLAYGTEDAFSLGRDLMAFLQKEARAASAELARKRGNFPSFTGSVYHRQGLTRMRNATTTTIAPTGSLSIIAGCSSGIEPLFALAYRRRILDNKELIEIHPYFIKVCRSKGIWTDDLTRELMRTGSIQGLEGLSEDIKRLFVTAHDLEPMAHLHMQAAFQAHTDNAVSKTVNLPRSTTPDQVRDIFWAAYELGLKGVTIYRNGSKPNQVLTCGDPLTDPTGNLFTGRMCPECGARLEADQGCRLCRECGYSVC